MSIFRAKLLILIKIGTALHELLSRFMDSPRVKFWMLIWKKYI